MPVGLMSAPATFQRLMQATMLDFKFQFFLVYLGDLLIYSKTFDEPIGIPRTALATCDRDQAQVETEQKCQFLRCQVTYLGHIISTKGVSCKAGKVEAVQNWPTPKTVTELLSFLSFSSYYRYFIKGFTKIAGPLHDLVNESSKSAKKTTASVSIL